MAMICKTRKIIFYHVPKNAGGSFRFLLERNGFIHPKVAGGKYPLDWGVYGRYNKALLAGRVLTQDELDSYTKISVVRNPYTRFISGWRYMFGKKRFNLTEAQKLKGDWKWHITVTQE